MNSKSKFSVGQNIKNLYEQIFDEIYPTIENKKEGVLYKVIHILQPDQLQAQEVCNALKIEDNAFLDDDVSISSDIIDLLISNPKEKTQWINANLIQPFKEGVKDARKNIVTKLESKEMNLFQIVAVGCLIVGALVCIKYIEKVKRERGVREGRQIQPSDSSPPQPKVPVPVALCLVVPAWVIENVRENNLIDVSDVENFIDNSLYFLCTSPEYANANQQNLELTNEDFTTIDEQREVYVRIDIANGEEMIGKKVPYILKRNLSPNERYIVKRLASLKYLSVSGLEKFNRV